MSLENVCLYKWNWESRRKELSWLGAARPGTALHSGTFSGTSQVCCQKKKISNTGWQVGIGRKLHQKGLITLVTLTSKRRLSSVISMGFVWRIYGCTVGNIDNFWLITKTRSNLQTSDSYFLTFFPIFAPFRILSWAKNCQYSPLCG